MVGNYRPIQSWVSISMKCGRGNILALSLSLLKVEGGQAPVLRLCVIIVKIILIKSHITSFTDHSAQ